MTWREERGVRPIKVRGIQIMEIKEECLKEHFGHLFVNDLPKLIGEN